MKPGHTRTTCPDNWRRYHATISASPGESSTNQKVVIPPKEDLLQNNNPWCCNCAKQGHYVHQCRAYRFVGLNLKNSKRNDNYIVVLWDYFLILPSTFIFSATLPTQQAIRWWLRTPTPPAQRAWTSKAVRKISMTPLIRVGRTRWHKTAEGAIEREKHVRWKLSEESF